MKHILPFWIFCLLLTPASAGLFDDDELLPVEQAFAVTGSAPEAETVQLDWQVAEGYYLYRDKLKFVSNTDGITLGLPVLPAGKFKHDEFFGNVETYRGTIKISIPITRSKGSADTLALQVASQGCADRGVCYPPHKQILSISLLAQEPSASSSAIKTLSNLGLSFGLGEEDELLPADEAFRLNVEVLDPHTLIARWDIAEGYYLYGDKFAATVPPDSSISPLPLQMPAGEKKHDEFFGDIEVYHNLVEARIPLKRTAANSTETAITFAYQGCAERGVCYPPIKKIINILLPEAAAAEPGDTTNRLATRTATTAPLSEQDALAKRLIEGNTLGTLLVFFGFGLLLAFTPCVFPMIPILSSIIVGQGGEITAKRGFILSSVYVLAMALTYTAAGVIAGLFGQNLQAAFQNPWMLSSFAFVFVLLAFSMFGFYELQMPAALQSRLTAVSNRQKGGNLTGVAVMGFLSALIVGPCVAAPLAAALIVIGQTGDAVLGGMALFALSMGMGAPLIAIGTGAGKYLPKAGGWMDATKAVFGVMLLAVAIWMLERILPGAITLTLWAALLIVSSIYMGALTTVTDTASGWKKFWKGAGLVTLVYGVLLLTGAATGGSDPLRPLSNLNLASGGSNMAAAQSHLPFKRVRSVGELDRELAQAKSQNIPVMLDYYADWCVSCKEMEKYTFAKAEVHQALSHMTLLQADVTANSDDDKALLKKYNLVGPPSIIFYDGSGQEHPAMRLVGYIKADRFVEHLKPLRP